MIGLLWGTNGSVLLTWLGLALGGVAIIGIVVALIWQFLIERGRA